MLELGESAQIYHQMIGAILADSGEDSIYSVGSFSRLYHAQESKHYAKVQDLLADFPCFPDDAVILVKASHGIRLEKLLPALRGEI
jgi:UDP-N-acetylmuramoyl-tripeptide--D-alanyl-D-alanine ligase